MNVIVFFQIEWKNKEEDEVNGDGEAKELTNGIEKLKILDMDENTKGIPKVSFKNKLIFTVK